MEEIKIYHSFTKTVPLFIGCIVFVAAAVFMMIHGEHFWIGLLSIIFFGGSGLFICFLLLRERLTGKAYLVISDKSLRINTLKKQDVLFSDVISFNVSGDMICINYKKDKRPDPKVIHVGDRIIDPGDGLLAVRLTQKKEEICALLNARVQAVTDSK